MTMDTLVYSTGAFVLMILAIAVFLGCCIGVCALQNRLQNKFMETMGGREVFYEFRDWYHNIKDKNEQK